MRRIICQRITRSHIIKTLQKYGTIWKGNDRATIYDTTESENYMQEHADNTNLSVLNEQLNSEESNYGIMFVKGYKYLDQFNVALQVLNNDGTYQKLKEQWIKTKE